MPSNTQNPTEAPSELQHLIKLLVSQLGINPDTIPATLTPEEAGKVLDTSVNTLAVWRSTGRYQLPFIKIGRKVRYPIRGIAQFMQERTFSNTGGAKV